jgi:hypothetical protein
MICNSNSDTILKESPLIRGRVSPYGDGPRGEVSSVGLINPAAGIKGVAGTTMPTEHERETAFLRRCIRYETGTAGRELDKRIAQVQRDERCVRRASWLMAGVAGVATAGLGYGAILLDDFPARLSVFTSLGVIKIFCALGTGSLICLVAFTGVGFLHRKELNRRREECRGLVTRLLESHLGEPESKLRNGELKERDAIALRSKFAVAPPETVNLPPAL